MVRFSLATGAAVLALTVSAPLAARSSKQCRAIADPAARLACYDEHEGVKGATLPPAAAPAQSMAVEESAAPVLSPAAPRRSTRQAGRDLKHRPAFDSQIVAVRPILHGYFEVELADGTIYETTQTGAQLLPGEAVHYRRSAFGTMFLDIRGRSPITVRLSSDQRD
ncbi:MAG TPA: hypothetical protein VNT42_08745 [Sphingomonas sp.]|nr:hypothetical protein [Sphingomonas sp.]